MFRPPLIALLLWFAATSAVAAEEARVDDIVATAAGEGISLSLSLVHSFEDPWRLKALQNGLPIVFVYQIDLVRKRENWFDSIISSSEIEIVSTYNSLTREYLLNYRRDRKLVSSESVRSIEELKRKMTTLDEERLFDLGGRNPLELRLRVRAVLGQRYLFHVIPKPEATDWATVRVREQSAS
ncbi:MAG: DUF4390 domain-containing protein [Acidobacteria bacterium]|nr:DUF4390 domain-containing protein [Acidobacteriota bacterium]